MRIDYLEQLTLVMLVLAVAFCLKLAGLLP